MVAYFIPLTIFQSAVLYHVLKLFTMYNDNLCVQCNNEMLFILYVHKMDNTYKKNENKQSIDIT